MHHMMRENHPSTLPESEPSNSADDAPAFVKGDFTILYDYVFNDLIKNRKAGTNKDDGSGNLTQDLKRDIEVAVEAFRGPAVPPLLSPIPLDSFGSPQAVQEPPELQAAKMEFLRSFAETQARSG